MSSDCGCKEVYRFPHITYPYTPLVSAHFCSSIPTFCSLKKMFFVLVTVHFCNLFLKFSRSINKHADNYGRPMEAV